MSLVDKQLQYVFEGETNHKDVQRAIRETVEGIRKQIGPDPDLKVKVEFEKSANVKVAMELAGSGEIYVQKRGRRILPTLKKVKKTLLRKFRSKNFKRYQFKDKQKHLSIA